MMKKGTYFNSGLVYLRKEAFKHTKCLYRLIDETDLDTEQINIIFDELRDDIKEMLKNKIG